MFVVQLMLAYLSISMCTEADVPSLLYNVHVKGGKATASFPAPRSFQCMCVEKIREPGDEASKAIEVHIMSCIYLVSKLSEVPTYVANLEPFQ